MTNSEPASVWSGLLLLHTSLRHCPHQAGAHPACHMEPILLTKPNCPWPRTLTHAAFSTSHLSPYLLPFPPRVGRSQAPGVQRLPHRGGPASTLRPRQEPDLIFDIKWCLSESHNPWTRTGMAGPKGCGHSPRDPCRCEMMNTHLAMTSYGCSLCQN